DQRSPCGTKRRCDSCPEAHVPAPAAPRSPGPPRELGPPRSPGPAARAGPRCARRGPPPIRYARPVRRALLVPAAALATALAAACGLPEGDYFGRLEGRVDPSHFRWCNQGEPDHLDPARASSGASVPLISAMYAGLTTYGPDGNPVPSLATRWEIDGDLRTYTFHLRGDARWSNGRPLTAYDVAYSALRVAHPLTGSPNSDGLSPLKGLTGYLTR